MDEKKQIEIAGRKIGANLPPFIIAEIGINHEGDIAKAIQLIDAAAKSGADCVKFQYHIADAEMIPNDIIPENAEESIWNLIKRCELTDQEERRIKKYCDDKGVIYLSTPFSREAADRLYAMNVPGFKIGSGECKNIPLINHVAKMGKPIILSTGMNDIESIRKSVEIAQKHGCPLMLMHCTSMYPTPYEKVRLGAIIELQRAFGLPVGLSDHSLGIYTCLGAVALGACALEKHFTISRDWPGPDIPISITPNELSELAKGARAIFFASGGSKNILPEEQPVINFAYASVVSIKDINKDEVFGIENIWVKRPGTGEILADKFEAVLGKRAVCEIKSGQQLRWDMIHD
jgi:N-acetylneuraminate synthase